jgi:(E)-4-hydroxy-3-methylbut-2-enyl-diphosphate synthase
LKKSKIIRNTRVIDIGDVKIGGDNPIAVQSMTKTNTHNVKATIKQIIELENAGCELIRLAIPDLEAAKKIKEIKKGINIPLIADVHFDHRIAIESIKYGADKIRLNPGNIDSRWKIEEIIKECKERKVPIRVGGNAGSIKDKYLKKYSGPTSEALLESVLDEIKIIESMDFDSIVVSLKSSNVLTMIDANRKFSKIRNYPLHLGITEAGIPGTGEIPSAIGIGTLLLEGIGDTIRVSLTGNPVLEVKASYNILKSINLRNYGVIIISCPTCGRLEYDMLSLLFKVEELVKNIKKPLTIAVMGCSVNGPGEAKEADIGIAGGNKSAVIFKKGKIVATVNEDNLIETFLSELNTLT